MKRKPIPLYMLDVLNAYQATGRVVAVHPFKGTMSLDGFPPVPYATAYDRMVAVTAEDPRAVVPIGQPARCWLRCPCGGPPLEVHELGPDTLTTCRCGVTYTRDGWTAGKGN